MQTSFHQNHLKQLSFLTNNLYSSVATLDVEVPSKFPADKAFKAFIAFDKIAPKVIPHLFKSIETVEGQGDVGSTKVFTFGDAIPFTSAKYKIDAADPSTYSVDYTLFEGDNLQGADSVNHHVKIVPTPDGLSVYKHSVVYNYKGDGKPPAEILAKEKETYETAYTAVEAYIVEHPEAIN